jgi:methylated-DNA-[protein]-cysteine S-methyltransferase
MTIQFRTVESPVGPLTLAGHGDTLTHLRMVDQTHEPSRTGWELDDDAFPDAVQQLAAYFIGERTKFDLDLDMAGTVFQRRVWSALQTIPYGETRSYRDIAEQVGAPGAFRAVGLANGRNPIGIIVPCHRVIGADGGLTGYGGGLDRKRLLLELEKRNVADEPLGRRAPGTDEPLGRRAPGTDEPLGRRAPSADEPLGRRASEQATLFD